MKILITGANGFIGKRLCADLCHDGYYVRAAMRSANSAIAASETVVIDSIADETDWSIALQEIDVVIHLAARVHVMKNDGIDSGKEYRKVNVEGTLNLAQQASKLGVHRFIFLSSIKVNGEQTTKDCPFTEHDLPNPKDGYSLSKLLAEEGLFNIARESDMEIVVIRPPLVYGPGVKANFANMMQVLQRGIPLPFGAIHNQRSLIYLGNLVSLVNRCIHHPGAANQLFFASDGTDLSTTELLRACAAALGVKARLLPMPEIWIMFVSKLLGKQLEAQRLCGSLQVNITKARTNLNWEPPVSVTEGLKATVTVPKA